MTFTFFDIVPALAMFAMLYAALTGWRFAMRVRSERAKRRKGVLLNVLRRAAPPVVAGLLVLVVGGVLGVPGIGWFASLLIAGGLGYGLHLGLAEMRQDSSMLMGLRLAASLGLTLAVVWQAGLV
jgi:hypothetical protein